jgi:hypothetical protein
MTTLNTVLQGTLAGPTEGSRKRLLPLDRPKFSQATKVKNVEQLNRNCLTSRRAHEQKYMRDIWQDKRPHGTTVWVPTVQSMEVLVVCRALGISPISNLPILNCATLSGERIHGIGGDMGCQGWGNC